MPGSFSNAGASGFYLGESVAKAKIVSILVTLASIRLTSLGVKDV